MARDGKWLSKVKRFFACAIDDLKNESDKRTRRERRIARRKLKHGERNSFISLFKEPTSSIEKILEDAEREQGLTYKPQSPLQQPKKASVVLPKARSPKASSPGSVSPRDTSPRAAVPRIVSPKATSPRTGSLRVIIPRAGSPRAVSPSEGSPRAVSPSEGSSRAVSPKAGSPKVPSPSAVSPKASSPRAATPRVASPRDVSPTPSPPRPPSRARFSKAGSLKVMHREEGISRIDPVLPYHHVSATKIQALYRSYASRKITGSAKGLVRLQRFVRGQSVRRQTASAMKHMQLLVRVQTRLQSQRFQMLECYALQHQEQYKSDKQTESITSDAGNNRDWDDSILTKEEKEARNKRKDEAVRNKERAMAFIRSHQLSKFTSESARSGLMDLRIDGLPWSWNWSERHLLKAIHPEDQVKKNAALTSPKSVTPRSARLRGNQFITPPGNSRSRTPSRFSQVQTPDGTPRSHYSAQSLLTKYFKPTTRGSQSPFDQQFSDTDSLRSCPTFSAPHYMSPTASASAKMRLSNNFKDRYASSPSTQSKRRLSYPSTPRSGTATSRGTLPPDSDASSQRTVGTNCSSPSVDNRSVGSLPDSRKPFNRFV